MTKSVPRPSQRHSRKKSRSDSKSLQPEGKDVSVPSPSPVRPAKTPVDKEGPSISRVGAQAPAYGTDPTTQRDDCETCQSYLQDNRRRLLPHLGRHVTRTGRPPHLLVNALVARHHKEICHADL